MKLVLEWQDIIGRESYEKTAEFEYSLPPMSPDGVDRDTFLFVNMHTLAYERAIKIFKMTWGQRIRDAIIEEVEKDYQLRLANTDEKHRELACTITTFQKKMNEWEEDRNVMVAKYEGMRREVADRDQTIDDQAIIIGRREHELRTTKIDAANWGHLKTLIKELIT